MRKHNTRVTRPEQDRTFAANKRRAKRRAARDALLAPYRKLLIRKDEQISKLQERLMAVAGDATNISNNPVATIEVTGDSNASPLSVD